MCRHSGPRSLHGEALRPQAAGLLLASPPQPPPHPDVPHDRPLSPQGDSGGPLVCKKKGTWVQVGVVSWGIGCSMYELPAVFTNVQSHVDWIRQQLRRRR